jgi:hypothetical protein
LAPRSIVHDIVVLGQSLLVIGGNFINATFNNIVEYDGTTFVPLSNKGLNGVVRTIEKVGDGLLIGGLFNNTADYQITNGLNNLAKYSLTEKKWYSLSGGVNDEVERISLVSQDGNSTQVHVAGKFNTLISPKSTGNQIYGNLTFGYAIWDDQYSNWLQKGFIDGSIGDIVSLNNNSQSNSMTFIAGNIFSAQSITTSGASLLSENNDLVAFPIYPQVINGIKSEIIINTGSLWNRNDNTFVIIGGKFNLQDQGIKNLAILKNDVLVPLSFDVSEEVKSLVVVDGSLFIGSTFNVTNSLQGYNGLATYDLTGNVLKNNQPPSLTGRKKI